MTKTYSLMGIKDGQRIFFSNSTKEEDLQWLIEQNIHLYQKVQVYENRVSEIAGKSAKSVVLRGTYANHNGKPRLLKKTPK